MRRIVALTAALALTACDAPEKTNTPLPRPSVETWQEKALREEQEALAKLPTFYISMESSAVDREFNAAMAHALNMAMMVWNDAIGTKVFKSAARDMGDVQLAKHDFLLEPLMLGGLPVLFVGYERVSKTILVNCLLDGSLYRAAVVQGLGFVLGLPPNDDLTSVMNRDLTRAVNRPSMIDVVRVKQVHDALSLADAIRLSDPSALPQP